tara:strand:+ start:270 stop:554 length:285 start_codon:yes stop_codon:yes gene_type:complete
LKDSSRFNFSNIKIDTGFIFIDDLNPDFDLTIKFNGTSDDMNIEVKGTNKLVIPKEKKPKMGITTNYIITGVESSFKKDNTYLSLVTFGIRLVS